MLASGDTNENTKTNNTQIKYKVRHRYANFSKSTERDLETELGEIVEARVEVFPPVC